MITMTSCTADKPPASVILILRVTSLASSLSKVVFVDIKAPPRPLSKSNRVGNNNIINYI